MKTYILSIAVTTVLSAVVNMITPDKWSKYVGVVTGLVVMLCIAQPIIGIMNRDTLADFSYTTDTRITDGEKLLCANIRTELEGHINRDIKDRLKRDFNRDCSADTEVAMTDKGEVTGVRRITVYGDRIDAVIIGKLRDVYGAEEVSYGGIKKTAEKSE